MAANYVLGIDLGTTNSVLAFASLADDGEFPKIGVLPIPLVACLMLLGLYQLGGFFLGHVYRDSAAEMQRTLENSARARLAHWTIASEVPPAPTNDTAFAFYRDQQRVAGDARAPALFPEWLMAGGDKDRGFRYAALPDGTPTIAAALVLLR